MQSKEKYISWLKNIRGQEFFHSSIMQWTSIIALLFNVLNWLLLFFFIHPVDFPIILHYNVYFGVDLIGSWWQMYLLPLIGAIILLINLILGGIFYYQKQRMIAHLLMFAAFVVQVSVLISIAGLIKMNY